jgi:hypothetical protein
VYEMSPIAMIAGGNDLITPGTLASRHHCCALSIHQLAEYRVVGAAVFVSEQI